jgi:hypothetical protein
MLCRYFKTKNHYCDFHIFSNNEIFFYDPNIGSLPTYYIKFFQGHVIFCDIHDYLENYESLMYPSYLVASASDLMKAGFTKTTLQNTTLLNVEGDTIYEV